MAITFSCPDCKATISVSEEEAGQRVNCPGCGAFVRAPGGASGPEQVMAGAPPSSGLPPALSGYIERARERERYEERGFDCGNVERERYDERDIDAYRTPIDIGVNQGAWNLTRIGLGMMYWGMIAKLLAGLAYLMILLSLLASGFRDGMDNFVLPILVIALLGSVLASFVVVCVGQCMCCGVPPESGARGLVVGSVVCLGLTVIGITGFGVLFFASIRPFAMAGLAPGPDPTALILMAMLFLGVVGIASHVLFVMFLRGVGRYFRNYDLVQGASNYLVYFFVLMGLNVVSACVQSAAGRGPGAALGGCMSLVIFVMAIVALIWHLRLIGETRKTIAEFRV